MAVVTASTEGERVRQPPGVAEALVRIDVLDVVDDEQHRTRRCVLNRRRERVGVGVDEPELIGDRFGRQGRIADAVEVDEDARHRAAGADTTANRVLPTPPGPIIVTSRPVSSIDSTRATSPSRPTSLDVNVGTRGLVGVGDDS